MMFLKKLILSTFVLFSLGAVTQTELVFAEDEAKDAKAANCKVDEVTGKLTGTNCEAAAKTLKEKIMVFVKVISTIVVAFSVGMIIYGGFKYVTSQGDPKQTEGAKMQIWYAGVGLFIVLTAFTILQLFMNATNGS